MILDRTEQQAAMDYIVYMIIGSYFAEARAKSPWRERGMRLKYCLLGQKRQYELEEKCDRYFDAVLSDRLPADFLDGKAEVSFCRPRDGRGSSVVFSDGFRRLEITSQYGGRRRDPAFSYHLGAA